MTTRKGSQIFELYGYPVDTWSDEAKSNLSECNCPFMDAECDGGGNRFSSGVKLTTTHPLYKYFNKKSIVQAGICSLQQHPGEQPWIVCPRRLLNYRHGIRHDLQTTIKKTLYEKSGLDKGKRYTVWPEVRLKCSVSRGSKSCVFDYMFDYVITGCQSMPIASIARMLDMKQLDVLKLLAKSSFTTCYRNEQYYCEDFPALPLVIVEVMTSSTCGGNKKDRTQISQLFEDTIYKLNGKAVQPAGPNINYRQVWARMVSQLLVKSQIGKAWGGSTFWVLQDQLVDYISKTTALDLSAFLAEEKSEVNVISGGYGDNLFPKKRKGKFALIDDVCLYSGPVSASKSKKKSFSDIIKIGVMPDINELWKRLINSKPCTTFTVN